MERKYYISSYTKYSDYNYSKEILILHVSPNTVFPRMLFALKLYSPSYSVRTTVWPECLLRSPSNCIRTVFNMLRMRDSNT